MTIRIRMVWISIFGAGLVVGVALILFLGGGKDRTAAVHAQGPAKAVKWEYCEFGTGETKGTEIVYLATRSTLIEKPGWDALAEELKVKVNKDTSSTYAIFDHLGSQGWEMCTALPLTVPRGNGGILRVDTQWVFKRPLP